MSGRSDRTLTLLHLRRTFSEYMKIPVTGSREIDPNRLLPLFTKVIFDFLNLIHIALETAEMIISLLCVLKDSAKETNQLLESFNQENGYLVIKDFLLRNENDDELVRNILLMLVSVINSGTNELKTQQTSGLVQLASFHLPVPIGGGLSVRNMQAFSLLYQIYLESKNQKVCATVIDVIHSIYTCDPANYFILDKEYPLSILIENMENKDKFVRNRILELVEYAVFQLNHIPCKELISICVLMKTELLSDEQELCITAVQSAFRLLTVDTVIKV
uniref:DUF2013 domain-containing protein n=1 Tax=Heterorhabditis bacteriophora TaxID=37862 RepID=A0A1I7XJY6_HETBA